MLFTLEPKRKAGVYTLPEDDCQVGGMCGGGKLHNYLNRLDTSTLRMEGVTSHTRWVWPHK